MRPRRLALAEASIDALYVATIGGMGLGSVRAMDLLPASMAFLPDARLATATDNDPPCERYAAFMAEWAAAVGVRCERLLPPRALKDWNDVLIEGKGHEPHH